MDRNLISQIKSNTIYIILVHIEGITRNFLVLIIIIMNIIITFILVIPYVFALKLDTIVLDGRY